MLGIEEVMSVAVMVVVVVSALEEAGAVWAMAGEVLDPVVVGVVGVLMEVEVVEASMVVVVVGIGVFQVGAEVGGDLMEVVVVEEEEDLVVHLGVNWTTFLFQSKILVA